jgi:protein phosphatase
MGCPACDSRRVRRDGTLDRRVATSINRPSERGPFDIVGDVHGCFDELTELLRDLGWRLGREDGGGWTAEAPAGRRLIFIGDLCDRGPRSPEVLRLAMDLIAADRAWCVAGNHDDKVARYLDGQEPPATYGLQATIEQLEGASAAFLAEAREFLWGLPSHLVLDGGELVVAHAGMREDYQGHDSAQVRNFALLGTPAGGLGEDPEARMAWAGEYRGRAHVVYGHTPIRWPRWRNRTINIDTGCVFGGALTALRWPERKLLSVPARRAYVEPPPALRVEWG